MKASLDQEAPPRRRRARLALESQVSLHEVIEALGSCVFLPLSFLKLPAKIHFKFVPLCQTFQGFDLNDLLLGWGNHVLSVTYT